MQVQCVLSCLQSSSAQQTTYRPSFDGQWSHQADTALLPPTTQ